MKKLKTHTHWAQQLANKIIEEKQEPYIISAGITTSGPAHLGTLCEFLFPSAIHQELISRNKNSKFYFFADIYDAFDSIPIVMQKYSNELKPHLGKPLYSVPDPTNTSNSFGDYFLDEVKDLMQQFNISAEIVRMNEVYKKGFFDKYIKLYIEKIDLVKKAILESSINKKELSKDWAPFMPICQKCGKIATTRVLNFNTQEYEYICDKDVGYTKGCGYVGKDSFSNHNYKLIWRLHWPAWLDYFKTSCEGAGVDHHTRGGSWSTVLKIFKYIFQKPAPIGYKYGFILFKGKKYSKSKGIGMGVSDLIQLLPPEIIKFILLKYDLNENIDIDPKNTNLLRMFDKYNEAKQNINKNPEDLSKAQLKDTIAFKYSKPKVDWKSNFLDIVLYYQIYQDFEKVGELLNDKQGVNYLSKYVLNWIKRKYLPEQYMFSYSPNLNLTSNKQLVLEFFNNLSNNMSDIDIHNYFFEFAKKHNLEPKQIFREIYLTILSKEKGPRLGKLIKIIGVETIKNDLNKLV